MGHSVVVTVPEVVGLVGFLRRHAEVLDVESEVCLSEHAVRITVARETIVAIRFVISGSDHPSTFRGQWLHLIKELF